MTIGSIAAALVCLVALWRVASRNRRALHLLQLEHYENARLFLWLSRRGETAEPMDLAATVGAAIIAAVAATHGHRWVELVGFVLVAALIVVLQVATPKRTDVKPLVFTQRARRLYTVSIALPALVAIAGAVVTVLSRSDLPLALGALLTTAVIPAAAWVVAGSNLLLGPLQRRVNARFEKAARARLAAFAPEVIGITGSYGKTTTKVCIGAVLSEHEPTLVTPASFNSFLGVIRTINEHLEPTHRDFVVEMGMYRAGDIDELCRLVHPQIGVLTAIGPMHLERMGTIEAIADAKAELALALPADGHLVVNGDDPRCLEIAGRVTVDTIAYGIENPAARVRAEAIEIEQGVTRFELVIDGERITARAGLLGHHNVSNLLAAAAVGHLRGMTLDQIARGMARVEPPEHRLQPLPNPRAGIVVIDDAYNANPAGAAAALEVLAAHPARRRILVTPGMVELGEQEFAANETFGRQAADVCDQVILVGPRRTQPIESGLRAGGMDPDAITVVQDIAAATDVLAGMTRAGDVILFENDLPDMYAEDSAPAAA
jgi:UDP-N-acetylmuramoyl-tripeptide--D-alanyl-D-alanine ligase